MSKRLTTEEFIEKSKLIHGKKYNYSRVNYINNHSKIRIICPKHGIFFQIPNNHMNGAGCFDCGKEQQSSRQFFTRDDFINRSKEIHGNEYDYSQVNYVNSRTKIDIICKRHGIFSVTPNNHISKSNLCGCPKCGYVVSKLETEFLDYLQIQDRNIYLKPYKIDGYDPHTKTIYEFLGDYWHGNPAVYPKNKYNKTCHQTFGKLYLQILEKFKQLNKMGYKIRYIWENDWNKFKQGLKNKPTIINYI